MNLRSNVCLHRRPGAVKRDQFASMVECGETASLPLEELTTMVDNVRMLIFTVYIHCTYMHVNIQMCSVSFCHIYPHVHTFALLDGAANS